MLKKRSGRHEDTIRELTLDDRGVHVGNSLANMRGVLTGIPTLDDARVKTEAGSR